MSKYMFEEMTWPAIEQGVRTCNIAVIPLGSMEPQPSHLPVGTDTFIVEGLVRRGAALVADDVTVRVLPPFDMGNPAGPNVIPEAMNLPWDVLLDLLVSILMDLYRQGFGRFVLVNGHGSTGIIRPSVQSEDDADDIRMAGEGFSYQTAFGFAYDAAAQFVEDGPDAEIFFVSIGGFFRDAVAELSMPWWQASGEGDLPLEAKTSLMLALHPNLVDLDQMSGSINLVSQYRFLGNPRYRVGAVMSQDKYQVDVSDASPDNVSAEIGEQLLEIWAQKFADVLRDMQAKSHLAGRYRPDAYKSNQP